MANTFPLFKGLGNEDPDQFSFVVKSVWEAEGVTNDHIKEETLVCTVQDCALTWYIKNSNDNPYARVADTEAALNREFSRPKSELKSIVGFKEITMLLSERP